MLLANLLITPLYLTYMLGVPSTMADVAAMLPTVLLPFNFIKAVLNGALVLLIYKPVSLALKRAGFVEKKTENIKSTGLNFKSLIVAIIAAAIIAASLCVMFLVLK